LLSHASGTSHQLSEVAAGEQSSSAAAGWELLLVSPERLYCHGRWRAELPQ
jgi:hypothetical protein